MYPYMFLLLFTFFLYIWPFVRRQLHMIQLNSYRNERYTKWLKTQTRHDANYLMLGLIVSSFILGNSLDLPTYYLFHALLFLLLRLAQKKQYEKKPLVFTWRIRRLLLTLSLVSLSAVLLMALILRQTFLVDMPFFLGIINLFLPALFILSNRINGHWERHISLGFTEEAKDMLKAMPQLDVIGITGSFGKTSTKNILNQLLSTQKQVLMTPESYNTPMGVVRTIREQLNGTHEVFIVEMGAKNRGDIRELCDIVHPKMGILSSIGEQHLETFGSLETIIQTKFELADAVLEAGGTMFLNCSNPHIRKQKTEGDVVRYGVAAEGEAAEELYDIWADQIKGGPSGSTFNLCRPGQEPIPMTTRLLGRHNVLNVIAALAVSSRLGLSIEAMVPAVKRLEPVPHRLQMLGFNGRYHLIDDAYNANPEGAQAAIETLGTFEGFRVLVTPGLVELGLAEAAYNRTLGIQAAAHCDFLILVGPNRALPIQDGALAAGFDPEKIYVARDIYDGLKMVEALVKTLETDEGPMYVLLENDLPDNFLS